MPDEAHAELLARELKEGADPELRAFAMATVLQLLDQLRMAAALAGGDAPGP